MSPPISLRVLDIQTHLLFTSIYFLMSRIFSTDLKNNQQQQQQQQQHQIEVPKSSGSSTSTDRPVYLGHTSLLATGSVPAVKTEPRSCDGIVGQPSYSSYYQHPHQLAVTNEHQQQSYYGTQETSYHHQHHVTTAAKLLASS